MVPGIAGCETLSIGDETEELEPVRESPMKALMAAYEKILL